MIAMEVFSSMLRRAISGGYLSGWRVSGRRGEGLQISHLLFEDDTLVFCEESSNQMTYLSWLLIWFEACSGLRINLEKSEMIPGHLSIHWLCGMWLKSVLAEGLLCGRGSIYLKGETHPNQKHSFQYAYLLYVSPLFAKKSEVEIGENSEGFSVGWGSSRPKTSPYQMELGLLGEKKMWAKSSSMTKRRGDGVLGMRWGKNGVGLWKAIRKKWGLLDGRAFNDWEIDLVERLLQKNHAFKVQREEEDKVIWTALNDGAFSVKSLYSMLERGRLFYVP
ncbi:hypothetical protein CK203_036761 [Vitis vinifera]|uniref:Reverse transcriptase domain-containing protein n=1 Tax=Vitis vinifera TaxID=29760 RepID=A0A438I0Q8_VITVI|nr:hypothetical protein CK203_036761 [Vitis vinifera]